jgi:D-alanyl-D-alanine carboxypeptidase/D-alanyl-D-alanine-endopeptidase (penicillin-binding protein 4)
MLRADAARHGDLLAGLMREKGLADDEGKELKSNPVRIHAKSGTLNFVSNLAGYVAAPGGELAFAIIAADPTRRAAVPMDEREQPKGGRSWTRRARRLHHQLILAWSEAYL